MDDGHAVIPPFKSYINVFVIKNNPVLCWSLAWSQISIFHKYHMMHQHYMRTKCIPEQWKKFRYMKTHVRIWKLLKWFNEWEWGKSRTPFSFPWRNSILIIWKGIEDQGKSTFQHRVNKKFASVSFYYLWFQQNTSPTAIKKIRLSFKNTEALYCSQIKLFQNTLYL